MSKLSAKSLSLEPIAKWPGGKSRVAKRLVRHFPPHSTYVEPFAGGAAVFWRKPLVKRNVVSDIDPWVIDLYAGVRRGELSKCSGGIRRSRETFERAKRNQRSTCAKVTVADLSFHGNRKDYYAGGKRQAHRRMAIGRRLAKARAYATKLRRSYVRLSDYAQTMRRFDGPETLHFLDPPWLLRYSDRYYWGGAHAILKKNQGRGFDFERLKRVAGKMRGYVFMIINNHPTVRRLFCRAPGWRCRSMRMTVSAPHGNQQQTQLIVTKNFGAVGKRQRRKRARQ